MEKGVTGSCHICINVGLIRYVNIYHMGSDGLDICWECERKLLQYLSQEKLKFQQMKTNEYKNKRLQRSKGE